MKIRSIALCVALVGVLLIPAAYAQNTDDLIELMRHDLKTEATAIMTEALALDPAQSEIFWPIWREYNLEWSKTGDAQLALLKDYAEHQMQMDDATAKELVERSFKIQEQRTKLRKSYWKKVDKELGGIIAARFVQIDSQLSNLVQLQISSQVPLVQAPN